MSKILTKLKTMTGTCATSLLYGHVTYISILDKLTLTVSEIYKFCTLEPNLTSVKTDKGATYIYYATLFY